MIGRIIRLPVGFRVNKAGKAEALSAAAAWCGVRQVLRDQMGLRA